MRSRFLLVLLVLGLLVVPNAYADNEDMHSFDQMAYSIFAFWNYAWDAIDQVIDSVIGEEDLGPTIVPTGEPEEFGPTIVPVG